MKINKLLRKHIVLMVDSHPNATKLTAVTRSTMFLSICAFLLTDTWCMDENIADLHKFVNTQMDSL